MNGDSKPEARRRIGPDDGSILSAEMRRRLPAEWVAKIEDRPADALAELVLLVGLRDDGR